MTVLIVILAILLLVVAAIVLYPGVKRAMLFHREQLTMKLNAVNAARAMLREVMRSYRDD